MVMAKMDDGERAMAETVSSKCCDATKEIVVVHARSVSDPMEQWLLDREEVSLSVEGGKHWIKVQRRAAFFSKSTREVTNAN